MKQYTQVIFTENGHLMLHHLAGATLQVANLVNYNCHPQEYPASNMLELTLQSIQPP